MIVPFERECVLPNHRLGTTRIQVVRVGIGESSIVTADALTDTKASHAVRTSVPSAAGLQLLASVLQVDTES